MKKVVLFSLFITVSLFSNAQRCSLGEVSSWIKETSMDEHKLYVKVTNRCIERKNIIISVTNSKGEWVLVGGREVDPGESYENYDYTTSTRYRYAIINLDQSAFHANDQNLWIYK